MKAYQKGLMHAVLSASEPKYGPYYLRFSDREVTSDRLMLATERGEVHTGLGTVWGIKANRSGAVDLYSYPYLNSLLGLRKVIVRREDLPKFDKITSISDLDALRVGQGAGWPDSNIYRGYGLQVVESEAYMSLFPMLAKGRFDYLPMSVIEIDGALEEVSNQYPSLVVAPNLYIFYPIPLYLSVSRQRPEISQRIDYGLQRLFGGDAPIVDELLKQYFPQLENHRLAASSQLLVFDNPYLEPKQNRHIQAYFKQHYTGTRLTSAPPGATLKPEAAPSQ